MSSSKDSEKTTMVIKNLSDLLHHITTSHILNVFLCFFSATDGSYSHMDEEEELYGHETDFSSSTQHSYLQERCVFFLTKSVAIQTVLYE